MKSIMIFIFSVLAMIALTIGGRYALAGMGIITLPVKKFENKVHLNGELIDKTYDTEYCLANYEWFKNTSNDIEQSANQIKNFQEQLDSFTKSAGDRPNWTFEDKQQFNTLTDRITGAKNYRADLVGQYNSRTEQLNRVACKELPLYINL